MAVLNDMYSQILKQQLTNNIKVKISEYVFIPAAGITLFSFIVDHPIDWAVTWISSQQHRGKPPTEFWLAIARGNVH